MMKSFLIAAVFFTQIFAQNSYAAKFANQFIEFDLPSDWVCLLEGTEWVCQNQKNAAKKKDAIIIFAAKIQGDQDTLDQYLAYLKNPKIYTTPQGKSVTSEVRYAQNKTIQSQPWVDALHLESEIPGFLTRYLATVKDGIGILVTYSVNKNKYQDYAGMFEDMVKSLKVFRREGGINASGAGTDLFKNTKIPSGLSSDTIFGAADGGNTPKQKSKSLMDDPMVFYGGIGAAALILLSILKKKKK